MAIRDRARDPRCSGSCMARLCRCPSSAEPYRFGIGCRTGCCRWTPLARGRVDSPTGRTSTRTTGGRWIRCPIRSPSSVSRAGRTCWARLPRPAARQIHPARELVFVANADGYDEVDIDAVLAPLSEVIMGVTVLRRPCGSVARFLLERCARLDRRPLRREVRRR